MNTSLNNTFTRPFDHIGVIVLAGTIFPLFVIGIIGNVITVATIIVSPRLKSTWYDLIFSLSVSDLMSAVNSPLYVYRKTWGYEKWMLPGIFCKLDWGFTIWTTFSTTLHILWFAILRFISIKWPHNFNNVLTKYTKLSIFLIWFVTFVTGFVPFMWIRAEKRDRSDPFPSSKWPACSPTKDLFSFYMNLIQGTLVIYVLIPCILVVIVSIAIGIKVFTMRKNRRRNQGDRRNEVAEAKRTRKENQLLLQLGLIVGSFIFGYFPVIGFATYTFFSTNAGGKINYWLESIQIILLRISECLNPLFYNLASSKMRKETLIVMRRVWLSISCKASHAPSNRGHEKTNPSIATAGPANTAISRV